MAADVPCGEGMAHALSVLLDTMVVLASEGGTLSRLAYPMNASPEAF